MDWEDYLEEVKDCAEYMMGEYDLSDIGNFDELFEALRLDDGVTGNGSGSFTYDRAKAEENIEGITDDDEVRDRFLEIGYTDFPDEAETVDVCVRLFALDELYDDLKEYYENLA